MPLTPKKRKMNIKAVILVTFFTKTLSNFAI